MQSLSFLSLFLSLSSTFSLSLSGKWIYSKETAFCLFLLYEDIQEARKKVLTKEPNLFTSLILDIQSPELWKIDLLFVRLFCYSSLRWIRKVPSDL